MVLTSPKTWFNAWCARIVAFLRTASVLASYLETPVSILIDFSRERNTYLARLLAKTTITSSVALLLAVVVASAMLAAANFRTVDVLGGHLSFSVLPLAPAAASRAAMTAWKDFCAGIRTDEFLVADINAAFNVNGMIAS